jgi:hypothetical protein
MKNFVRHIVEPNRLLLAWQAPEGAERTRFIVAELQRPDAGRDEDVLLRYLRDSDDFRKATQLGFSGHPAFTKTDREYSVGVVDALMRRLPPRTRADFPKYLELLCIAPAASISNFALLGYSGAKLPSDGFSVIHPFDNADSACEFLLEVAGFRYMPNITTKDIRLGASVSFEKDPTNKFDSRAIKIMMDGKNIGYVNRGQLNAFHRWLEEGRLQGNIERLNGTDARPLVHVFVEVAAAVRIQANQHY